MCLGYVHLYHTDTADNEQHVASAQTAETFMTAKNIKYKCAYIFCAKGNKKKAT